MTNVESSDWGGSMTILAIVIVAVIFWFAWRFVRHSRTVNDEFREVTEDNTEKKASEQDEDR